MSCKSIKNLAGLLLSFAFAGTAVTQPAVYFTNIGPSLNAPFADTYGCLLGDTWKAELIAGADPSQLAPAGLPAAFISTNGCSTGFFNGGIVTVPTASSFGTLYAAIRVWTGADTYTAALANGAPIGQTGLVELTANGNGPFYLTGLQAPWVGPITPWFMAGQVDGGDLVYGRPLILTSSHNIDLIVAKPLLAYRTPTDFHWQKLNSESNWVDIAGPGTNSLHLASVGPNDAGEYRVVFNFGCGCDDQIGEAGVAVVDIDNRKGLTLNGPVGGKYRVDYLNQLARTNAWQTLTNIVLSTGSTAGIDPGFPNSSQRYYRVAYTP